MERYRVDEIKDWIARNPLRQFRKQRGISMMKAAGMIGCGMSSIQSWENGAHLPTLESIERLAVVLGIANMPEVWTRWYHARPGSQKGKSSCVSSGIM